MCPPKKYWTRTFKRERRHNYQCLRQRNIQTTQPQFKATFACTVFLHSCPVFLPNDKSPSNAEQTLRARGQTSLDHIPSMVSILPGKLAVELKLAHLFIPQFCYALEMSPSHFSSPLKPQNLALPGLKCGSLLKHLFGVGGERGRRREPVLPCSCS